MSAWAVARRKLVGLAVGLGMLGGACFLKLPGEHDGPYPCATTTDCVAGYRCVDGWCTTDGGSCQPTCGDRKCGPDPTCGVSCGVCEPGAYCSGVLTALVLEGPEQRLLQTGGPA